MIVALPGLFSYLFCSYDFAALVLKICVDKDTATQKCPIHLNLENTRVLTGLHFAVCTMKAMWT